MLTKQAIHTDAAPQPSGTYSAAIKMGNIVHLAGQIGKAPTGTELVGDMKAQLIQIFKNLSEVAKASGGSLDQIVKLTVYLKDFKQDFAVLNQVMPDFFKEPFPARTTIGVAALPAEAAVEIDAVMILD